MENRQICNALDFLMFSYFGITFSDEPKKILFAAVKKHILTLQCGQHLF